MKRRGIPFNDTPECAEKKGVFRERLREMKMLSADQNPHVMVPVAGPVLPWPGTSDTARTSSSSSGVVIPQPNGPDPIVRRGLKRASDGGNMGIVEIYSLISDVNVNEEPHPQIPVMVFSEEERQALWAELARLGEFEAKKDISRDQDIGPLLTFMWVRTVKNGAPNYRLCLRLFWSAIRKEQGLFPVRLLDHRFTKCCLFWLLNTVGV